MLACRLIAATSAPYLMWPIHPSAPACLAQEHNHVGFRATLLQRDLILPNYICPPKPYFSVRQHSEVPGVKTSTFLFGGNTMRTMRRGKPPSPAEVVAGAGGFTNNREGGRWWVPAATPRPAAVTGLSLAPF